MIDIAPQLNKLFIAKLDSLRAEVTLECVLKIMKDWAGDHLITEASGEMKTDFRVNFVDGSVLSFKRHGDLLKVESVATESSANKFIQSLVGKDVNNEIIQDAANEEEGTIRFRMIKDDVFMISFIDGSIIFFTDQTAQVLSARVAAIALMDNFPFDYNLNKQSTFAKTEVHH